MSLTVTQRPNQSGVWVAAKNPVIYKMTRKDFTWTTLVTSGGNTSIQIATNVTASFVAGDTIWLQSDDGAYSASGTVVSSAFGAATTVITTVPYVADNASGYINIISRRPNYYVGVGVYKSTDNSLIGTVNYYPTTKGLLTIDVSSVLLSVLDPSISIAISEKFIENAGISELSTAVKDFYIKYTEFWTGSGNSATDDVANISYGVLAANQIGQSGYLTTNAFLTKFDSLKIMIGEFYCLSFADTVGYTSWFIKKSWYDPSGTLFASSYVVSIPVTALKSIYTYSQALSNNFSTMLSWREVLTPYINIDAGTSWTFFPTTITTAASSKWGSALCYAPSGITFDIYWTIQISGSAATYQLELGWFDTNGTIISSSVISTGSVPSGTISGTKSITSGSNVQYVGLKLSPTNIGNVTAGGTGLYLVVPNTKNRIDFMAASIPATLPYAETDITTSISSLIVQACNAITLFWRNSQGGESSWPFGYTQDSVQKLQDPFKNNWLTLYEQNLTLAQFNALNELFSVNQVYQTPIIELTTSVDKTEARVGQQVYTVDTSGNKIGVIVIGGENKTRTRNKRHSFQVTIELPEIFG